MTETSESQSDAWHAEIGGARVANTVVHSLSYVSMP
jgi:hypothetical protein